MFAFLAPGIAIGVTFEVRDAETGVEDNGLSGIEGTCVCCEIGVD